jgi:hypothetical protein
VIDDLDETIRELILKYGAFAPDSVAITFDQPTGDWAASLTRPTINCYLYDVRENLGLRSAEWTVERRENGQANKRIAPRRYDLSYMVSVWTQNQVGDEHAILWRVLAVLANHPVLPKEMCQGELARQSYPVQTRAGQPSEVVTNPPDLWGALENRIRPIIDYVVTLAMERDIVFTSPLVFAKRVQVRQQGVPGPGEEILQIAGIVRGAGAEAQPVVHAEVTLSEIGRVAHSDDFGRYSFANIPAGTYRVRARAGQRVAEHTITVPAAEHDAAHYDLVLS